MLVQELIAAAYKADREGRERDAIRFYDEAYRLGVPPEHRRRFFVGYGSTLRNVGRADDAVGILGGAIADDPGYAAYAPFLALALLDSGHARTAVATMLGSILELAPAGSLDGYERALGEYHAELIALDAGIERPQ